MSLFLYFFPLLPHARLGTIAPFSVVRLICCAFARVFVLFLVLSLPVNDGTHLSFNRCVAIESPGRWFIAKAAF